MLLLNFLNENSSNDDSDSQKSCLQHFILITGCQRIEKKYLKIRKRRIQFSHIKTKYSLTFTTVSLCVCLCVAVDILL